MIVCHCNVLGSGEIEDLVRRLGAGDPHRIITPGTVFQGCGMRPNCGACMPLVVATVAVARQASLETARARTVVSDPASVASLDMAGRAGDEQARGGRCRTRIAVVREVSTARGARR